MNGRTATITAGPAPGLPDSMSATATARPAPARGREWPGMRPWPLFSALGPMGALPTAPGLARAFTVMVLGGWRMADPGGLAETSTLVVSELATNVVRAATSGDGTPRYRPGGRLTELWLRLMSDRARLRIELWDNLPPQAGTPARRHAAADDESGRGLDLIQALSLQWGWDPLPAVGGKSVWALLPAREA
jgi:hypothetical protein